MTSVRSRTLAFATILLLAITVGLVASITDWSGHVSGVMAQEGQEAQGAAKVQAPTPTVEVTEKGLRMLAIGRVGQRDFKQQISDVGVIDFNPDMYVQVFPSYQGKIIEAFVKIGAHVEKDEILYTIDSPDLVQAESTLIQTAGVLDLANRNLARLRQSVKNGGGAQKDLDQAQSDQQTAVGAYKAARLALTIYGKTEADADRIVANRVIEPALVVKSPISGTVAARTAAPGLLVQPGTAPAPYTVANLDQVRLYDFVSEDESPAVHLGQEVEGRVPAYPGRIFSGRVTRIAPNVDPNTHRLQVESQIDDPAHLLRPNMFADLIIHTGPPVRSAAVPTDAVVRLGDGTMTVWIKTGDRSFTQRSVVIGLQQGGFDQVLEGLQPGTTIVTKGAVFVSNMANANAPP